MGSIKDFVKGAFHGEVYFGGWYDAEKKTLEEKKVKKVDISLSGWQTMRA